MGILSCSYKIEIKVRVFWMSTLDFLSCFKDVYETLLVVEYWTVLPGWSSEPRHMHTDLMFKNEYANFIVFAHTGPT